MLWIGCILSAPKLRVEIWSPPPPHNRAEGWWDLLEVFALGGQNLIKGLMIVLQDWVKSHRNEFMVLQDCSGENEWL